MPRQMTSAMLAAIAAGELMPAIFVEINFVNGPVYFWSGFGNITWNGFTWVGVGDLGSISPIEEGSDVTARGINLMLSGFNSTTLQNALGQVQLGLPVIVYLGFFASGALVASPIIAWAGRIDQPTVDVEAIAASISIACENRLIDMNNSNTAKRYTDQQNQIDNPGDTTFSAVSGIQSQVIYWGANPSSSTNL